ncbi:MAG: hypothetical protein KAR47_17815, partial [Planctomycetes bacterium]|nr:hypothetical protein [Planctomycetota bacterium]
MNNANSNINGTDAGSAVIAITQEQDQLKAVMLRRKHGAFELIRTASVDSAETNLQSFAAEFTGQTEDETIVVGYGSAGMVFYRINVPNAKKEELAALVRLQTEASGPLPIEQMEFAWRSGSSDTGQVAITIAAARKEQLQNFAAQVAGIRPEKIMLNCEGIVKAWKTIFSGDNRQGLVLDIGVHSTQVCMVEDGRLGNAASLDMGTKDFSAGQAETAERFAQDMRSILKLFGVDEPAGLPIFVLSDGQTVI